MCRILLATLAICLIAVPASAAKFVAVPDINTGVEPLAKATADCRIENLWNNAAPCTQVFWSYGGWCLEDEITSYFPLQNDVCLAGCTATNGFARIESAEMGLRVVGTTCNNGYPVTTYPADGVFGIFLPDPILSLPDCPVPNLDPICQSVVTTVPALTATASTDPARSYNLLCTFDPVCCIELQPVFGSFRYVAFSLPESSLVDCGNGGISACAWWYPGFRGRNGTNPPTECAIPCTQYFRNVPIYGPDWYESMDAGLGRQTEFAMWLNVSCGCPTAVEKTTWGKLKSLMNN
jgi:hypothetical protein